MCRVYIFEVKPKRAERQRARELRAEGRSLKEIAASVGASLGSVSLWVRDVPLTAEQQRALAARDPTVSAVARARGQHIRSAQARAKRLAAQEDGRVIARSAPPEFAAACVLFWAEGSRCRNVVHMTNSDPALMAFFLRVVRGYFEISHDMVAASCNLFVDHVERQREIERFWLAVLCLPESCLRKSIVNVYSKHSKKLRKNKLPYGTCRLSIYSTYITQALYGAIQEIGGFEREEWLTL